MVELPPDVPLFTDLLIDRGYSSEGSVNVLGLFTAAAGHISPVSFVYRPQGDGEFSNSDVRVGFDQFTPLEDGTMLVATPDEQGLKLLEYQALDEFGKVVAQGTLAVNITFTSG